LVGEDEQEQREVDRRHGVQGIEDRLQLRARVEGEGEGEGRVRVRVRLRVRVRVTPAAPSADGAPNWRLAARRSSLRPMLG
jgi:hypothetical protein